MTPEHPATPKSGDTQQGYHPFAKLLTGDTRLNFDLELIEPGTVHAYVTLTKKTGILYVLRDPRDLETFIMLTASVMLAGVPMLDTETGTAILQEMVHGIFQAFANHGIILTGYDEPDSDAIQTEGD